LVVQRATLKTAGSLGFFFSPFIYYSFTFYLKKKKKKKKKKKEKEKEKHNTKGDKAFYKTIFVSQKI
jgi:phosphotransferase system  glucose/maltose/N-acetylglucosamine-specific IIC component